jgi:hypothetical protein
MPMKIQLEAARGLYRSAEGEDRARHGIGIHPIPRAWDVEAGRLTDDRHDLNWPDAHAHLARLQNILTWFANDANPSLAYADRKQRERDDANPAPSCCGRTRCMNSLSTGRVTETLQFGQFLHQCARTRKATRIVEFGASMGISTIHLAAALRDMGGGHLIGTEFEPSEGRGNEFTVVTR